MNNVVPELFITPGGQMHLAYLNSQLDTSESSSTPRAVTRITDAFQRGANHGLLHLGAVELATALSPSLAFGRELAHLFMVRLCGMPDLANTWSDTLIPAPLAELEQLINAIPPMLGAEYLTVAHLEILWADLHAAACAEIAALDGNVTNWLARLNPSWNMLGRICFHLAENKNNDAAPFAFLATYAARISTQSSSQSSAQSSTQSKVLHQPLGRALQEYAKDRSVLLNLLEPINKATEQSPWLKSLVDTGAIFHPIAWTPKEAHQFLKSIPTLEASGIIARIPDWWNHKTPRPQVQVNIGKRAAGLGLDTMLDFDITLSLGDEQLSREEWEQLQAAGSGLVRFKGRWVELDREKLNEVLSHWKKVQRDSTGDSISFLKGMRLLSGAALDSNHQTALPDNVANWSNVVAGDWFKKTLDGLRHPRGEIDLSPELQAQLRPYQQDGVQWLWYLNQLGLGGCLADDMGLGKTLQVIALFLLIKRDNKRETDPVSSELPHLIVLPASLIGNWQSEIARFAPGLRVLTAHSSALSGKELSQLTANHLTEIDVVITTYGNLIRIPWLLETPWSLVVLDEAQAIKNPAARQTRAAKELKSRVRLALTGTPVENSLGDLWSLFDFISPGLLGSDKTFSLFTKQLEKNSHADYAPLRNLVQPYILRRLKSDKRIIADLPDKTEVKAYCSLSRLQASLYEQSVTELTKLLDSLDGMQRRGAVLAFLMRFKQICNHPSQWSGDGSFNAEDSGKFARLREITEAICARQEKVLIFTQFQEMTAPIAEFLRTIFGRPGLVLHGGTPVKARKAMVDDFQQEQGPPFFVLSIKAGGTGLNLTAASHVIHFDRWWNPAVENQATDRAYRIGQKKNVLIHKFICRGTIEEKINTLIESKQELSTTILSGGEMRLTEMSNEELLQLVSLDINSAINETIN